MNVTIVRMVGRIVDPSTDFASFSLHTVSRTEARVEPMPLVAPSALVLPWCSPEAFIDSCLTENREFVRFDSEPLLPADPFPPAFSSSMLPIFLGVFSDGSSSFGTDFKRDISSISGCNLDFSASVGELGCDLALVKYNPLLGC